MKRKREDDNTIIDEIIKRLKLCLENNKKRKREDDDENDVFALSSCKKRIKLEDSNILRQNRRDILVYL